MSSKFYSEYGVAYPDFTIYWKGSGAYHYYRYVNFEGKHGDIAEIELYAVPAPEYGDTDNDGTISNKDIAILIRYFVGEDVTFVTDDAVVNQDGQGTHADAMILARYMAGWEIFNCRIMVRM